MVYCHLFCRSAFHLKFELLKIVSVETRHLLGLGLRYVLQSMPFFAAFEQKP